MTSRPSPFPVFCLIVLLQVLEVPLAQSQGLMVDGQTVETHADGPCWDSLNRYVDCRNGTVTDTVTELVWLETGTCADLPGVNAGGVANWPTAQAAVAILEDGLCGLTDGSQQGDWRLPSIEEWAATIERALMLGCGPGGPGSPPSLTNTPGTGCFIDSPQPFIGVQAFYWSSSLDEVNTDRPWHVDLNDGNIGTAFNKNAVLALWAVRDGR